MQTSVFPGLITTAAAEICTQTTKGLSQRQVPRLDLLLIGEVGYTLTFVRNVQNATLSTATDNLHAATGIFILKSRLLHLVLQFCSPYKNVMRTRNIVSINGENVIWLLT